MEFFNDASSLTDSEFKEEFLKRFFNYSSITTESFLDRFLTLMTDFRIADSEVDEMLTSLERKYGYTFEDDDLY